MVAQVLGRSVHAQGEHLRLDIGGIHGCDIGFKDHHRAVAVGGLDGFGQGVGVGLQKVQGAEEVEAVVAGVDPPEAVLLLRRRNRRGYF